jgi:hypothetical protein
MLLNRHFHTINLSAWPSPFLTTSPTSYNSHSLQKSYLIVTFDFFTPTAQPEPPRLTISQPPAPTAKSLNVRCKNNVSGKFLYTAGFAFTGFIPLLNYYFSIRRPIYSLWPPIVRLESAPITHPFITKLRKTTPHTVQRRSIDSSINRQKPPPKIFISSTVRSVL